MQRSVFRKFTSDTTDRVAVASDLRAALGLWDDSSNDTRVTSALDAAHAVVAEALGRPAADGLTCAAYYTIPAAVDIVAPLPVDSITSVKVQTPSRADKDVSSQWAVDPADDTLLHCSTRTGVLYADTANYYAAPLVVSFAVANLPDHGAAAVKEAVLQLGVDIYGRLPETVPGAEPMATAIGLLAPYTLNVGMA